LLVQRKTSTNLRDNNLPGVWIPGSPLRGAPE
jgi:hypothetical protein